MNECSICKCEIKVDQHMTDDDGVITHTWRDDCINAMLVKIAELEAYADKLAKGLPEGMLPKDIENMRNANWKFAEEIRQLKEDVRWIPISEPPTQTDECFLLDYENTCKYECGYVVGRGFYSNGEWHLPTGSGTGWTHWIYCYKIPQPIRYLPEETK